MLTDHHAFPTSNKEKRLCARVLAGCVFNELLPSNRDLMQSFLLHLERAHEITYRAIGLPIDPLVPTILHSLSSDLDCDALRIELVNHVYQAGEAVNASESADLRVIGRHAVVSVDFAYPLREPGEQTANCRTQLTLQPNNNLLRVLLVTRRGWAKANTEGIYGLTPHQDLASAVSPFAVVFWEDILALVCRFAGPRPLISYLFGLLDF